MSLTKILGIQPDKWDNPEESTGELVGQLRGGRYRCWEATGRARRAFEELSPEIKDYLEASSIPPSDTVSWSVYMIGRTKETATPKILICSTDIKNRKHIRKLIKESKIISKYPGMGLGDVSVLPDRQTIRALSREVIQALLPPGCNADGAVLIEESKPPYMGKRLFVVDTDFSLRPTTAGPVVVQNERYYQLTVAHVFHHHQSQPDISSHDSVAADDCDFDGMSDDEDESGGEIMKSGSATPEFLDSEKGSFTARLDMPSSMEGSDVWFTNPKGGDASDDQKATSATKHNATDSEPRDFDAANLRYFGSLALSSTGGNNPSLDYALIELATDIVQDLKQAGLDKKASGFPSVSFTEETGVQDTDVVAATSSRHLATGRLTATPCFVRLPGQVSFQKVYPARLDKPLVDGDCGSAIISKENGHFYGHIVAGGPGTCVALLVSADDISRDVKERTGCRFTLLSRSDCLEPQKCAEITQASSLETAANPPPAVEVRSAFDNHTLTTSSSSNTGNLKKNKQSTSLRKANPLIMTHASIRPQRRPLNDQESRRLGRRPEDRERELASEWLEEREAFPQFCMTCEKQFIPVDEYGLYCSTSCRIHDQDSSSPLMRNSVPSSYLFPEEWNREPRDIIPRASPSRANSTPFTRPPTGLATYFEAPQYTSAVPDLWSYAVCPPSSTSLMDSSLNLRPSGRGAATTAYSSRPSTTSSTTSDSGYSTGGASTCDDASGRTDHRRLPSCRAGTYSQSKTIELIQPASSRH